MDTFWDLPGPDLGQPTVWLNEDGEERKRVWGSAVDVMIEAKDRDDVVRPSLIDLDAYKEMLELHNYILNITFEAPEQYKEKLAEPNKEIKFYLNETCSLKNITDARVEKMAARGCQEFGEQYCIVEAPPKCRTS